MPGGIGILQSAGIEPSSAPFKASALLLLWLSSVIHFELLVMVFIYTLDRSIKCFQDCEDDYGKKFSTCDYFQF